MAVWPHEETPLTEREKDAYRYLLYQAMLDIRTLCQSRGRASLNPLEWRRQYLLSRTAGWLADWLHNLAHYASMGFRGFDADWFWQEYDGGINRYAYVGPGRWMDYRSRYEEQLARLGGA